MSELYLPSEDSVLLADEASKLRAKAVLEIGVGSGFITSVIAKSSRYVVGTELSKTAIRKAKLYIKEKGAYTRVDLVLCNGASAFRPHTFDAVVFNPPYLPKDRFVDRTIDGGKDGIEISKAWVEDAVKLLKKDGVLIFVTSTLSKYHRLVKKLTSLGFELTIARRLHLFFEELMVIRAKRRESPQHHRPLG